jgi:hypothetical protein
MLSRSLTTSAPLTARQQQYLYLFELLLKFGVYRDIGSAPFLASISRQSAVLYL